MVVGEVENLRVVMFRVFNVVFYWLMIFFMFGSLVVGVFVLYIDEEMKIVFLMGVLGVVVSLYVIVMNWLNIRVLLDIVNVMVLMVVFLVGNSYVYCVLRFFYGMVLEGKVLKIFIKVIIKGVFLYVVLVVLGILFLSFL